MIEPLMYFAIGFLIASLVGIVIIPLVHGRAVRLTLRRLEAATPLLMAEIQADKDQLRAEFAVSTRRLEMSLEEMKNKTTSQFAELGKKGDAINRLMAELGEKTAIIFALEARGKALRDQLHATEEELAVKTKTMHEAERALSDREAELAKLVNELDQRSVLADSQKVEIVALQTQVEVLKDRLTAAEVAVKTTEDRLDAERAVLQAATAELAEERGKVERLSLRVAELEQHLVAQTAEAEIIGRRAHDLENKLQEQLRQLHQSEFELNQLRSEIETACKIESDLRVAIIEVEGRASSAIELHKAEKTRLQAELDHANDEYARLQRDIANTKRDTEQARASERVENALLRESINDVAAEVARLASTLEGPNSPIDAILAAESVRDRGTKSPVVSNGEAEFVTAPAAGNGDLADRIRALQNAASRVAHSNEPTSRN